MNTYQIASHPTIYSGVQFRSRLEARWAAFFDLTRWDWKYEPIDLQGWTPDFWVAFPCGHSECTFARSKAGNCDDSACFCKDVLREEALVYEKFGLEMPYNTQTKEGQQGFDKYLEWLAKRQFHRWGQAHFDHTFRHQLHVEVKPYYSISEFEGHVVHKLVDSGWSAPHPAMFGIDPSVSSWQMVHGAGGGYEELRNWVDDWRSLWNEAGNIVQWQKRMRK